MMTFTWNDCSISYLKMSTWFIICLNNKWIFFKPRQSSGRALKFHLKYLNELYKFRHRLRFIAVLVIFLAVSTPVSISIHFITAGHSALMITESICSFQLDKWDLIIFSAWYCCVILSLCQHVFTLSLTHTHIHIHKPSMWHSESCFFKGIVAFWDIRLFAFLPELDKKIDTTLIIYLYTKYEATAKFTN